MIPSSEHLKTVGIFVWWAFSRSVYYMAYYTTSIIWVPLYLIAGVLLYVAYHIMEAFLAYREKHFPNTTKKGADSDLIRLGSVRIGSTVAIPWEGPHIDDKIQGERTFTVLGKAMDFVGDVRFSDGIVCEENIPSRTRKFTGDYTVIFLPEVKAKVLWSPPNE